MNTTRRNFLTAAGAGAAGLSAVADRRRPAASAPDRRPNLLYVIPDQFRVFALGFMQADPVVTPNLDRFAAESVVFDNAVSSYPVCSPHRGMLFTGRWPHSTGVISNCNTGRPEVHLKPSERCLSDVLAAAGYSCGYIGKYHLDTPLEENAKYTEGHRGNGPIWDAYTPPGPRRHGFEFWHSYGCCDRHLHPHYWVNDAKVSERLDVDGWSVAHETEVALEFLRNEGGKVRDPEKPFALFVAFNPPHPPYSQVPEKYKRVYADRSAKELLTRPNVALEGKGRAAQNAAGDYFAAVTGVDDNFGRILAALAETGAAEETLVVFSSDHGEMLGSHGRMGKSVFYEESFRIPFLLRYPRRLKPGRESLHLNTPDVMPTLLGLLGIGDRVPPQVEGTDYSSVVTGQTATRPPSSFYLSGLGSADLGSRGVRTDRYTFVVSKGAAGIEVKLFDRETDPFQMKNLASTSEELCKELLTELNRWLVSTHDPWPPLTWPPRAKNTFAVRREGDSIHLDFEPDTGDAAQSAPTNPCASFTEDKAEVLAGTRSLKADTLTSSAQFHEYLRLSGVLKAGRTYEVRYAYKVLGVKAGGQFYTVVRSQTDANRKASRLYWDAKPGDSGTKTFTFNTGAVKDHVLLFGVKNRGSVVIDEVVVREVK